MNEHLWVHTCMKVPEQLGKYTGWAVLTFPRVGGGCCVENKCEPSCWTKYLESFANST